MAAYDGVETTLDLLLRLKQLQAVIKRALPLNRSAAFVFSDAPDSPVAAAEFDESRVKSMFEGEPPATVIQHIRAVEAEKLCASVKRQLVAAINAAKVYRSFGYDNTAIAAHFELAPYENHAEMELILRLEPHDVEGYTRLRTLGLSHRKAIKLMSSKVIDAMVVIDTAGNNCDVENIVWGENNSLASAITTALVEQHPRFKLLGPFNLVPGSKNCTSFLDELASGQPTARVAATFD